MHSLLVYLLPNASRQGDVEDILVLLIMTMWGHAPPMVPELGGSVSPDPVTLQKGRLKCLQESATPKDGTCKGQSR